MQKISFLLLLLSLTVGRISAQTGNLRYQVMIDLQKAYISGVCIMHPEGQLTIASIMNEFGVSALTYSYDADKEKVKILSIMQKMNKWYIKKVLKKDLKKIMQEIGVAPNKATQAESIPECPKEEYEYLNKKYNIKYNYRLLSDETTR